MLSPTEMAIDPALPLELDPVEMITRPLSEDEDPVKISIDALASVTKLSTRECVPNVAEEEPDIETTPSLPLPPVTNTEPPVDPELAENTSEPPAPEKS
jgi:hypothetical protein